MQKKSTKNWGQADKDLLNKLINRQLIDITDTPHLKIEQVRLAHFCHRNTVNFYRNFREFLAAWDQELKYSGAQRREGRGKMGCLFLLFFCLLACPLTHHLPPPHSPFFSEEEVADQEEGDADDYAINDSATNNRDKDMPPKAKPTAAKGAAAAKPAAAAAATATATAATTTTAVEVTVMPPLATKKLVPYFLNACDAAVVTYYNVMAVDYAKVEVQVSSVVLKGSCKFTVAAGGMSISWLHATNKICFASKHLKAVMKDNYSTSHNHVIAYKDIAQKMTGNKVTPDAAGRFWGGSQEIRLKAHVTHPHGIVLTLFNCAHSQMEGKTTPAVQHPMPLQGAAQEAVLHQPGEGRALPHQSLRFTEQPG